jgi:hypothetical protein
MADKSLKQSIAEMVDYMANNGMKIDPLPKLKVSNQLHEGPACLHPTGHYDPQAQQITVYTNGRHQKDILKTIAHELIHHEQNLRGDLSEDKLRGASDAKYTQNDEYLREIEREAYERSALLFRDWTDHKKYGE